MKKRENLCMRSVKNYEKKKESVDKMDLLNAIIQGIIQGLTEFLPVSSSGHLRLYQALTGQSAEEGTFLLVILHFGTLLAVFVAFWDIIKKLILEFCSMVKDIFTKKFSFKNMNGERRMICMLVISLALLIPCYPFKDIMENVSLLGLGFCFLFTSVILFLSDRVKHGDKTAEKLTVKDALVIGGFQCAALFPGVSRSGSTICGGIFSGVKKETAVEYSFVMGIPTILAGCLSELKDALDGGIQVEIAPTLIGFIVAAVTGLLAIKLVKWLIRSDNFKVFSIYTLIVSILTFVVYFTGFKL